jgi:subtilisin family serine protease
MKTRRFEMTRGGWALLAAISALLLAGWWLRTERPQGEDVRPSDRLPTEATRPAREASASEKPGGTVGRAGRRSARDAVGADGPADQEVADIPTKPDDVPVGPQPRDAIPHDYILYFGDAADQRAFEEMARSAGLEILDRLRVGSALRVRARDRAALDRMLAESGLEIGLEPNIRAFVPEIGETPARPPHTPYVAFDDRMLAWLGVPDDNADWGAGVTVAVLDTGVTAHPALDGARMAHLSLVPDSGAVEGEQAWHGTAVASLLGGRSPSLRGLAPGATLLSVGVLGPDGQGDLFTLANGIVAAVDHGARVVNLSLGSYSDAAALRHAVRYAAEHDVLLVAAVGNDGRDTLLYPARYAGVLAVAGVDAAERHLYFSNRGDQVDLAAPALQVPIAWAEGGRAAFTGTSAAAPLVSAAAAWLMSENPDLSARAVAELLMRYAGEADAPGHDAQVGAGILDIRRLAQRHRSGLYDVAVRSLHVPPAPSDARTLTVEVVAQNTGTETLSLAELRMEGIGPTQIERFRNVAPGQVMVRSLSLPTAEMSAGRTATLVVTARLPDVEDAYPGNNRRVFTLEKRANGQAQ